MLYGDTHEPVRQPPRSERRRWQVIRNSLSVGRTGLLLGLGFINCSCSGLAVSEPADAEPVDTQHDAGCTCSAKPSLACLCAELACPATVADATNCAKLGAVAKREGCGYTWVQIGYENAGFGYFVLAYDDAGQTLVGVKTRQEQPFGPCNSTKYTSDGFPDDCATASECGLCGHSGESGDAGPC